jgi:annexin A7/11
LIDILVGRNPVDLLNLSKGCEKTMGSTLAVALSTSVDESLNSALSILLEFNRPLQPTEPIDTALVSRDVDNIKHILTTSFPRCSDLFNILLRRSDRHIAQISLLYQMQTKTPLDKEIRQSYGLPPQAVKIAVQAVRTATNMTYRDAMLLRTDFGHGIGSTNKLALGIRVCRMHWNKTHWMQVKAEYHGVCGKNLADKMRMQFSGVFEKLLVAMAMV